MKTEPLTHSERSSIAQAAWAALPAGGHDFVRLSITCAHGHHVAQVYATGSGLVYSAPIRARSHGHRDQPDQPHDRDQAHRWFDLLDTVDADDSMPAWCDCGHRVLSRASMREWLTKGEHHVVVD